MATHRQAEIRLRRWLALGCILAPIVFGLLVFTAAYSAVIPATLFPGAKNGLAFTTYAPAEPASAKSTEIAGATKPGAAPPEPPDATMFLPARDYNARVNFAMASGFLFIIALTTLLFAIAVLVRYGRIRLGRYDSGPKQTIKRAAIIWTGVALLITFVTSAPHGRYLVVHDLLDKADGFATLEKFAITWFRVPVTTGTVADWFVHFNTAVSLMPVGMLLTALAAITLPDGEKLTTAALKARLTVIRIGLSLGSACFVIAVLSNKALVDWPLQLVRESQAKALRPIADSIVAQFGAVGTAALFGAFAPAIIAWLLDLETLKAQDVAGRAIKPEARAAELSEIDKLVLAPMSAIGSVVAVLAPVLASPVVDSLKVLLGPVVK
ncbi:MAG: hypothetical protein ACTHLO_10275 [Pseudolabrys sp.]